MQPPPSPRRSRLRRLLLEAGIRDARDEPRHLGGIVRRPSCRRLWLPQSPRSERGGGGGSFAGASTERVGFVFSVWSLSYIVIVIGVAFTRRLALMQALTALLLLLYSRAIRAGKRSALSPAWCRAPVRARRSPMACVPDDDDLTLTSQDDYRWQNFVQTIDYTVPRYFEPRSLGDLAWITRRAEAEGRRVKAVGSGWSIEDMATSRDWMVDLRHLNHRLDYLVEPGMGARALTDEWQRLQFGDSDEERLVHVEAGIKIIDLNRSLQPGLAMVTLGGAQGQQLAGTFSTGTHRSDYEHAPLCDLIQAVHLVTTNGEEVWIESSRRPVTRDDASLRAVLPCAHTRIIRDDDALDAVVCGMGRFGIIYSCVVLVTRAFRLAEWTEYLDWTEVSAALASGIGRGPYDTGSPFGSINSVLSSRPGTFGSPRTSLNTGTSTSPSTRARWTSAGCGAAGSPGSVQTREIAWNRHDVLNPPTSPVRRLTSRSRSGWLRDPRFGKK
jgi:hypothetical protein